MSSVHISHYFAFIHMHTVHPVLLKQWGNYYLALEWMSRKEHNKIHGLFCFYFLMNESYIDQGQKYEALII